MDGSSWSEAVLIGGIPRSERRLGTGRSGWVLVDGSAPSEGEAVGEGSFVPVPAATAGSDRIAEVCPVGTGDVVGPDGPRVKALGMTGGIRECAAPVAGVGSMSRGRRAENPGGGDGAGPSGFSAVPGSPSCSLMVLSLRRWPDVSAGRLP